MESSAVEREHFQGKGAASRREEKTASYAAKRVAKPGRFQNEAGQGGE